MKLTQFLKENKILKHYKPSKKSLLNCNYEHIDVNDIDYDGHIVCVGFSYYDRFSIFEFDGFFVDDAIQIIKKRNPDFYRIYYFCDGVLIGKHIQGFDD